MFAPVLKKLIVGLLACAGFALTSGTSQASPITNVGLELSLLVDSSGSIDANEFNLQRQGYVNAFKDPVIQNLIANTPGGVAVNFVYWAGNKDQQQAVGWTRLTDAASSIAFANAIAAANRPFNGSTAPGSAINFAVPLFASNAFNSDRQVIDVSGDGAQNDGANTLAARNAALLAGIDTINGLPILGSEAGLLGFYQNNIQGGTHSFTTPASNFADFDAAVRLKLALEISGADPAATIPEPATLATFGLMGALGLGYVRRRLKNSTPVAA